MFTIITSILLIIYSNKNIVSHFKYFQVNPIKIDFPLTAWNIKWIESHLSGNRFLENPHQTRSRAKAFNTLTTLKASIKDKMSFLGLSRVSGWNHHIFVHIPSDGIVLSKIIAYFSKNWPMLNRHKNVFSNRSLIRFLSLICSLPCPFVFFPATRN